MRLFFLTFSFVFFAPSAHADEVKALVQGPQSFSAYLQSIQGATRSIDIATYQFEPCQSAPKLLLSEMIRKAKAGVKVRILLEVYPFRREFRRDFAAFLKSESRNIELRYVSSPSYLTVDGTRLHAKEFVADSAQYIVGGRNITDSYFGLSRTLNYLDQDLLIRGGSAREAQARFNELWSFGWKVAEEGDAAKFRKTCFAQSARDRQVAAYFSRESRGIVDGRPARSCAAVTYVADYPDTQRCSDCDAEEGPVDYLRGERWRNKRSTRLFLDFLAGTRERVEIANQFYMPWEKLDRALERLRNERKQVAVFTNATGDIERERENRAFTCYIQKSAAAHSVGTQKVRLITAKGALSDAGPLSIPGASWRIHTKSAIRDGRDVFVSSFNIDPRSYMTNIEAAVMIEGCEGLAGDLRGQYAQLEETYRKDRTCPQCRREILPENLAPRRYCGGHPTFY